VLELGCVPDRQQNDAIASERHPLRRQRPDRALVSHNLSADCSCCSPTRLGCTRTTRAGSAGAELVERYHADDPLLSVSAGRARLGRGSGGMASKLSAARMASWSGVRSVIASASRPNVLVDAVAGVDLGTTFMPHDRKLSARKLWIGFASQVEGAIVIDDGARRAVVERATSLLPAGVTEVRGHFFDGATVELLGPDGCSLHAAWPPATRPCCGASPAGGRASSRPTSPTRSSTATTSSCSPDRRSFWVAVSVSCVRPAVRQSGQARPRSRSVHLAARGRSAGGGAGLRDGLGGGGGGDGGGRCGLEAELVAQLAEAALRLDVRGGLLDLEDRLSTVTSPSSDIAFALA
jgi:hypothetical protein